MIMATTAILKPFNVVKDIRSGKTRVLKMRLQIRSCFRLLVKDLATALSEQFPLRLMLGSRLFASQKRFQTSLSLSLSQQSEPLGLRADSGRLVAETYSKCPRTFRPGQPVR